MLINISKEESKKAKEFLRKSSKDGLNEIIIRVYNDREYKRMKFQTTSLGMSREYRDITIEYTTEYGDNFDEVVIDINYGDMAVDYITSEKFYMELYKNNNKGIHFEDEHGNITDTIYFIDTVCLYKVNKKGYKDKMIKIDKIGYRDNRMIK